MEGQMLTPQQLWKDFDPYLEDLDIRQISDGRGDYYFSQYRFTALKALDGNVRVAVEVLVPLSEADKTVLIVGDYSLPTSRDLLKDLVQSGYIVVIPDLSGVCPLKTEFPESLSFGNINLAGERLNRIVETPFETNQFLYSRIVRRTIVFIENIFPETEIMLMTVGDGAEIGIQVAGITSNLSGLICLNGGGYREYLNINRYLQTANLELTEERTIWLSTVAAVAYAKNIKVPMLIAMGTNSTKADPDRVNNLQLLLGDNIISTVFTPNVVDYIHPSAYNSVKLWMFFVFNGFSIPSQPEISIKINEDKKVSIYVDCDPSLMIEEVSVFTNIGEYDHRIRDWQRTIAKACSYNEYITTLEEYDRKGALFAFAEVRYANDMLVTSLIEYLEPKGKGKNTFPENMPTPKMLVLYRTTDGVDQFVEDYQGQVLLTPSLRMSKTAQGAHGLVSDTNGLMTFSISSHEIRDVKKTLQISICAQDTENIEIILTTLIGGQIVSYVANKQVNFSNNIFIDHQFDINDFKDDSMKSLKEWVFVKALTIRGKNILVGNILFI